MSLLSDWIPSTVNHLYWSILTCKGDPVELKERFCSIIHHVVNRHSSFVGHTKYTKCEHAQLSETEERKKKWMRKGTQCYEKFKSIVLQKQVVADLSLMTELVYTTLLEVFHSVKIRYLPKSIFFNMEKMIAGTQLAALDHNLNCDREQVSINWYFFY